MNTLLKILNQNLERRRMSDSLFVTKLCEAALAYEKRKAEVGGTWNDYSHGFEDGWRIALAELLPVIGSMDCRGDEDCDHCVGLRLIRGKRKGGAVKNWRDCDHREDEYQSLMLKALLIVEETVNK